MPRGYSYFTLELDTTPPHIEIVAPQLIVPGMMAEIYIVADESLDTWHDIYVIDGAGIRHDLTFAHQGDVLYGLYDFWDCQPGIATIYAQSRDDVHNLSNIANVSIQVVSDAPITQLIGRYSLTTQLQGKYRLEITADIDIDMYGRLVISYDITQGLIGRMQTPAGAITINLTGKLSLHIDPDDISLTGKR